MFCIFLTCTHCTLHDDLSLNNSLADPDPELRGGGGGSFDLLALLAFLHSAISSSFTQNKARWRCPPGPSPRSGTTTFGTVYINLQCTCTCTFTKIFSYLIGEVETLLANDTATIEEIITIISVKKK